MGEKRPSLSASTDMAEPRDHDVDRNKQAKDNVQSSFGVLWGLLSRVPSDAEVGRSSNPL